MARRLPGVQRSAALILTAGLALALPLQGSQPVAHGEPGELPVAGLAPERRPLRADPFADLGPSETLVSLIEARRKGERAVFRLDGPLSPERQDALTRAGVLVQGHLPGDAVVVDLSAADASRVAGLDFVRWRGGYRPEWKRAPDLATRDFSTSERRRLAAVGRSLVIVTLFPGEDPERVTRAMLDLPGGGEVHRTGELAGSAQVVATLDTRHLNLIADQPGVQFVEDAPELTDRSNLTTSWVVQSNILNSRPLYDNGLRGEDQVIGIIDGAFGFLDMNHCSFRDAVNNTPGPGHRKVLAYNVPLGVGAHATHVSATAAGDNGVADNTRGIAYNAKIVYASRPPYQETDIYNALALHHSQGARVHSNSWGDDTAAWYTSLVRGIDTFSHDFEESVVLYAVTNLGSLKSPENAKNALAVAASQQPNNQGVFCSGGIGPTADGRRKPEVFAPGCLITSASAGSACSVTSFTGTSMACPAVAGIAALTRQYFVSGLYPSGVATPADALTPSGALMRAVIINSGVDMTGIAGFPSNQEGWGRVLADNTLYFAGDASRLIVRDVRNADGLQTGDSVALGLSVNSPAAPLKVTLVWTDPPAALGAHEAIINDLDLELISPMGVVYRGNFFAAGESAPGGIADRANTVEQTLISMPDPGDWTVRVRASGVNAGPQGYAVVVTGDVSESPAPLSLALTGLPSLIDAGCGPVVTITVNPNDDALVPGSVQALLSRNAAPPVALPLMQTSTFTWTGALPQLLCGESVSIHAFAEGSFTGVVSDPPDAPASAINAVVTGQVSVLLAEDFEASDGGWTVGAPGDTATGGIWEWADPVGTTYQPSENRTPGGANCWITGQHTIGQSDGFNDVDNGSTSLLSPVFDLTAAPSARIEYWRWFGCNTPSPGQDSLTASISNNGGASWIVVDSAGLNDLSQAAGGWFRHAFRPADFLPITATMRMKFTATDANPGHIVEAAIDDWSILLDQCVFDRCAGDANLDGVVDFNDLTAILSQWNASGPAGSGLIGDANGDGLVDFNDITSVLANWLTVCCP